MWIVIRPDHYGREPTIDFYESVEYTEYKDFVIKEFHTINELKYILNSCIDTMPYLARDIKRPADIWYFECLNETYYIDNDSVAHTQLFKSWGLSVDIKTINKELVKGNGFESRPYSYYE